MTRRKLFKWVAGGMFAQVMLARGQEPSQTTAMPPDRLPGEEKGRKLKVVFVGAHVDDWAICAGTLARYARKGHSVVCLSFTPGDSLSMAEGNHMSVQTLAAQRREDAVRGTKIIGAQFKILNQHNQEMHVDPEAYMGFNKTLAAENPDIVFGMWPIEYHPDHRAAANLAFNAWLQSGMNFVFYFCETPDAGEMTPQLFVPNRWVDISSLIKLKRESVIANRFIKDWWPECEMWAKFRGEEYGCRYAEAFVRLKTVGSIAVPKNPVPGYWYSGLKPALD